MPRRRPGTGTRNHYRSGAHHDRGAHRIRHPDHDSGTGSGHHDHRPRGGDTHRRTAAPEVVTPTTVPEVFCAEGLVSMPEYATDTDDGCRFEVCNDGRGDDGWCLAPEYVEVENPDDAPPVEPSTDPEDHPCDRQVDSDDGVMGICTAGGVRYCFDNGWGLCPAGGGERCPPLPADRSLAFRGPRRF